MEKENTLKIELEHFDKIRAKLLETNEGQFVLIKESELIGAFTTQEQAYQTGIRKFGVTPFLIKQITKKNVVHKIPALFAGLIYANI